METYLHGERSTSQFSRETLLGSSNFSDNVEATGKTVRVRVLGTQDECWVCDAEFAFK